MAAPFDFARLRALPDIRDRYLTEDTQSDMLDQTPVPANGSGRGLASREDADTVDTVVCALRQLYAHIAFVFRDGEGVREEEERNPLLRLAWTDFRQGDSEDDERCVAEHAAVREAMCVHLRNQGSDMTFFGLAESRLMNETLLKRGELFRLYYVPSYSRPAEDFDAPWQEDGPADLVDLAINSLVEWDGRGTLEQAVCIKLGALRDDRTNRTHYFVSNEPAIIRVRYQAPMVGAPTFETLRTLTIENDVLFTSLEGAGPMNRAAHHVLIMVVRLRRPNENRDLLRRYYTDGRMVLTPPQCSHADDGWRLSEPGREYMLYYARVDAVEAGIGAGLPEVPREPAPLIPVRSRISDNQSQGPSSNQRSQRQQDSGGRQGDLGEQRRPSSQQHQHQHQQGSGGYGERSRSPLEHQRSPNQEVEMMDSLCDEIAALGELEEARGGGTREDWDYED